MVPKKSGKAFKDMKSKYSKVEVFRKLFKIFMTATLFITYSLQLTTYNLYAKEPKKFQSSGLFNIRNLMPMYVFYMSMAPKKAQTLKKGQLMVDTGYHVANVIIKQHDPWPGWKAYKDLTYDILIDAEVNRYYADISYGLLDNLEVGVNIPYFDYTGGYLDSFIENFEDAFSFIKTPNARENTPKDDYRVNVVHFGETVLDDRSKPSGLGEITLEAKYRALKEEKYIPEVSLRAALKLPTSDDSAGLLGSDKADYGFGILLDKQLLERLYMYMNINIMFIERPDILDKLNVDDYILSGAVGFEVFLTDRTSMIFQTIANSAVYDKGVSCMERDAVVFTVGFNHNFTENVSWQISMDENSNTAAPDFGLMTSLKIKI
jgi:hypothetical protein